jgi:hypothetical protein
MNNLQSATDKNTLKTHYPYDLQIKLNITMTSERFDVFLLRVYGNVKTCWAITAKTFKKNRDIQ